MSHFQVGWAEYSITPDKKVSLAGQFAERISEYVEKPICVTALALSTDTDQAVFVVVIWSAFRGAYAILSAKNFAATHWDWSR